MNCQITTEMSLSEAFADRGAKRVIGFRGTLNFDELNEFLLHFAATVTGSEYAGEEYFEDNSNVDLGFDNACLVAAQHFEGATFNEPDDSWQTITTTDGRTLDKYICKISDEERIVMIGDDLDGTLYELDD